MDVVSLIPAPDAIPVHWLWFQLLLTITTFMHLIAMNITLGTGAIAVALPLTDGESVNDLRRRIGKSLPYSIALTINFGVAPLLFLQVLYGQFLYTSSVLMGGFWLSIIGLLIIAYYATYIFTLKYDALGGGSVFISIAVVILLTVAFLYVNNLSLMQMPESWHEYFVNRDGWLLNFADRALLPRYLHFVASAIAIGGLAIAFYYEILKRRGHNETSRWIKTGCNWFSIVTVVNFGIGFWFFSFLPAPILDMQTITGKIFISLLGVAIFCTFLAVIKAQTYKVFPATIWALSAVFLMTLMRDLLRVTHLKPFFNITELPVNPQYSPLLIFLVALAGAVYLISWMLKTVWAAKEVK